LERLLTAKDAESAGGKKSGGADKKVAQAQEGKGTNSEARMSMGKSKGKEKKVRKDPRGSSVGRDGRKGGEKKWNPAKRKAKEGKESLFPSKETGGNHEKLDPLWGGKGHVRSK